MQEALVALVDWLIGALAELAMAVSPTLDELLEALCRKEWEWEQHA